MKLRKRCKQALCTALAEHGSSCCAKHKANDSGRGEHKFDYMYNKARWRKLRKAVLLDAITCVACGCEATEVDHIVAHRGDYALFYDTNNLQAMCKSCHSSKTAQEQNARRGW